MIQKYPSSHSVPRPSGTALVLVLTALALIGFMALAILTFIRSEDRASRVVADFSALQTLQGVPEKLVISQIRRATSGLGDGGGFTWTSQPGMIRVFGQQRSGSGVDSVPLEEEVFKLYSSDRMSMTGAYDPTLDLPTGNWRAQSGVWTNLNQPLAVTPIRQPGGVGGPPLARLVYPIFHPETVTKAVPGFANTDPNTDPAMPVRWLYILSDGQMVAAQARGDNSVVVAGASKTNPIVGRVAFWADDESCKLNVNAASEAAPWTRPVTTSLEDKNQAQTIPTNGEHYRDAAHPASVSLSPVLQRFGQAQGTAAAVEREPRNRLGSTGLQWFDNVVRPIHDLLPQTPQWSASDQFGSFGGANTTTAEVEAKRQRWFTSSDELFFDPSPTIGQMRPKNVPGTLTASAGLAAYSQSDLEWARFFLTSRSRAPETNPFGGPKISLWPVQAAAADRHELDRKMVLAASLPTNITTQRNEYYFQRSQNWVSVVNPGSSQSAIEDINLNRNTALLTYLETLTDRTIPGAGGAFSEKYGFASRNQILVSMFDMLRWGVNPISPYDQQLRNPYKVEYSAVAPSIGPGANPFGIGSFSSVPSQKVVLAGEGGALREDVTLPPIWVVKGLGRFPTIGEVSLVLMAVEVEKAGNAPKNTDAQADWADKTKSVQAFVVVEPYFVTPGSTPVNSDYRLRIRGLDTLVLATPSGNAPLGFQPDLVTRLSCSMGQAGFTGDHSAYGGMASQFIANDGTPRMWTAAPIPDEDLHFAFAGPVVDISALVTASSSVGEVLELAAAKLTVGVYDTPSPNLTDSGALVQQLEIDFPPMADLPVPLLKMTDVGTTLNAASGDPLTEVDRFKNRFTPVPVAGVRRIPFLHRGDVVVSVEAAIQPGSGGAGDLRLLAATPEAPPRDAAGSVLANGMASYYRPIPMPPATAPAPVGAGIDWRFQNHTLRDGAYMLEGQPGNRGTDDPIPTFATAGALVGRSAAPATGVPVVTTYLPYDPRAVPAVPVGSDVKNFDNRPGDFDNGPGILEDGPYINIPEFTNGVTEAAAAALGAMGGPLDPAGLFQRGGVFFEDSGVTLSPWRQMGSAIGFGSLPSGVYGVGAVGGAVAAGTDLQPRPWQTLLFCANPPSRTTTPPALGAYDPSAAATVRDHFGFREPRDHWWLEFFWMPAVEPGGLVDGYATEGKVNMNYQIVPFTNIRRATAMHGALNGVRITAIPSSVVTPTAGTSHYKRVEGSDRDFLYGVNATATLEQFQQRFDTNRVFVSPSEICDLMLVPEALPGRQYATSNPLPTSAAQVMSWWEGADPSDPADGMEATGDNTREAAYGQLYPKLCTRSNIFKVHYRVQALQKVASTDPKLWVEGKDRVAGEYRGESVIERYIDPSRVDIVDFATNPGTPRTLDDYCDYRVLGRKQFAP